MSSLNKKLISPLLSISIFMLGIGFFQTFVSLELKSEGYSSFAIGMIQACYYGGFMLGAIKIEKLISRLQHIRAFAAFSSILTASLLLQGMIINPLSWAVLRFIGGVCIASLYVVIESWLLMISPVKQRGRALAFYMIALYAAQSLCQFIIDFIDLTSKEPYLIASLLCALSIFPVTFTSQLAPEPCNRKPIALLKTLRGAPFGCLGCMLSGTILSSIYSFAPIYCIETDISVSQVMFSTIAGGFILQWPLGLLSDYFDRRKILIFVSCALLLPCIGILFSTYHLYAVLSFSILLGGLTFTLYPLGIAQVCDRFHEESITSITGVLLLVYSFGSVIGPLVAPFFVESFHPYGLYLFISFVAFLLALCGFISTKISAPIPKEKQSSYTPTYPLTSASTDLELHPDKETD